MLKQSNARLLCSLVGILYVWALPFLADIGFANKNASPQKIYSISDYISTPPATGAMACISYLPLVLMREYQDYIVDQYYGTIFYEKKKWINFWIDLTLELFQFFYGMFLICTLHYVPNWLHYMVVTLFGIFMIIHYSMILRYIEPLILTQCLLIMGSIAYFCLIFVHGKWFWICECVGFTSMLLFSPIEWYWLQYSKKSQNKRENEAMIQSVYLANIANYQSSIGE